MNEHDPKEAHEARDADVARIAIGPCRLRAMLQGAWESGYDYRARAAAWQELVLVFSGGPGPAGAVFVEAEVDGRSVRCGEWARRADGLWTLTIPRARDAAIAAAAREYVEAVERAAADGDLDYEPDDCSPEWRALVAAVRGEK